MGPQSAAWDHKSDGVSSMPCSPSGMLQVSGSYTSLDAQAEVSWPSSEATKAGSLSPACAATAQCDPCPIRFHTAGCFFSVN